MGVSNFVAGTQPLPALPVIDVFMGTKAQYIKTAPLLRILSAEGVDYRLIDSGQHAKTAADLRRFLGVKEPDVILQDRGNIKTVLEAARWFLKNLALTAFRPSMLRGRIFSDRPGLCIVHGDTPSTLLGLLMAKRAGKTVVHLEAGLRSFNLLRPFPEELIRIVCMKFSDILFAPSDWAESNLRKLRVRGRIINVGQNTNVEALYYALAAFKGDQQVDAPYCVVTVHRVETIMSKDRLRFVLGAIERISKRMKVVFVQHDPTEKKLKDFGLQQRLDGLDRVIQRRLLPHSEFLGLVAGAEFVVTDGGSIQEECYYLDCPCLVMRSETERLEGLGTNVALCNFDLCKLNSFLSDYRTRTRGERVPDLSPSRRIADVLLSEISRDFLDPIRNNPL